MSGRPCCAMRDRCREQAEQEREALRRARGKSRGPSARRTWPRWSPPGRAFPSRRLPEDEGERLLQAGADAPRACRGAGRGGPGGRPRAAPRPRGPARSEAARRLVSLSRPHGRGQDGAVPRAGRRGVRRRGGAGAPGYVGVYGAAYRLAAHRRAAGLRRLRRGRAADREGAPPPVVGGALRRDRKGAPGRLRSAAANFGGRCADRRAGAAHRLPQYGACHDLERGREGHHVERGEARLRAGRGR